MASPVIVQPHQPGAEQRSIDRHGGAQLGRRQVQQHREQMRLEAEMMHALARHQAWTGAPHLVIEPLDRGRAVVQNREREDAPFCLPEPDRVAQLRNHREHLALGKTGAAFHEIFECRLRGAPFLRRRHAAGGAELAGAQIRMEIVAIRPASRGLLPQMGVGAHHDARQPRPAAHPVLQAPREERDAVAEAAIVDRQPGGFVTAKRGSAGHACLLAAWRCGGATTKRDAAAVPAPPAGKLPVAAAVAAGSERRGH